MKVLRFFKIQIFPHSFKKLTPLGGLLGFLLL